MASGERPPRDGARAPTAPEAVDPGRRLLVRWLWRTPVLLVLAGGGVGVYEAVRIHFEKVRPDPHPTFDPRPASLVAPLARFAGVWDAVEFELQGNASAGPVPAIAVRLPGPIPGSLEVRGADGAAAADGAVHLAAFSRVCTHRGCIVELNRDLAAIDFGFNYTTNHPALTCACHLSVFDPELAGRATSGPAREPLPRVELELREAQLIAVGLEPV